MQKKSTKFSNKTLEKNMSNPGQWLLQQAVTAVPRGHADTGRADSRRQAGRPQGSAARTWDQTHHAENQVDRHLSRGEIQTARRGALTSTTHSGNASHSPGGHHPPGIRAEINRLSTPSDGRSVQNLHSPWPAGKSQPGDTPHWKLVWHQTKT